MAVAESLPRWTEPDAAGVSSCVRARSPPTCRATPADVPALSQMLARAFLDDPVAEWSCRPDALRPRVLERFNSARLRHLLPEHEVWTTPELATAALWAPPARWRTTVRQDLELARCLLHPRLLARAPLIGRGLWDSSATTRRTRPTGTWRCWVPTPPHRGRVSARLCCTRARAVRRRRCGGLPGVLQGAQHRLLRPSRLPCHRGA